MSKKIAEIDRILDGYLEGALTEAEVQVMHRQLDGNLPSGDLERLLAHIELPDELLSPRPYTMPTAPPQRINATKEEPPYVPDYTNYNKKIYLMVCFILFSVLMLLLLPVFL